MKSVRYIDKTKCFRFFVDDNYRDFLDNMKLEFYDEIKSDFDNDEIAGIWIASQSNPTESVYVIGQANAYLDSMPSKYVESGKFITYMLGGLIADKYPELLDPKTYQVKKDFTLQSGAKSKYYFTNNSKLGIKVGLTVTKSHQGYNKAFVFKITDILDLVEKFGGPKHSRSYLKAILAPFVLLFGLFYMVQ